MGGGDSRVALALRHQHQAGGGGHFDDGGVAVDDAPGGIDGCAQRAPDGGLLPAAAFGRDHRLHGAGAAIGHGHEEQLGVGKGTPQAVGYGLRGLDGGEAALELLRGDDDPHHFLPWPL
jgi:hypothetical protein